MPTPYILCEDPSVIGTPFYVVEFVQYYYFHFHFYCIHRGRIFRDFTLRDQSKSERTEIYAELVRVLTQLHSYDYEALGLKDYGKAGAYYERQVCICSVSNFVDCNLDSTIPKLYH